MKYEIQSQTWRKGKKKKKKNEDKDKLKEVEKW